MSAAPPSETRPKRTPRRWPFWLAVIAGVLLLAVLLVAESLYLARRTLAREAVIGWLRERGVESEIEIESLELDGFTGRVRIGPASDPEVTVDRAEVKYRLLGPWTGQALGVEIGEVRLVRPLARASLKGGKFSMGSLDRVLDEFRQAPPKPDARQPKISVEDGRFLLTTDYGLADLRGGARLEDGKLLQAAVTLQPTALRIGEVRAEVNGGRLNAVTRGDRVAVQVRLGVETLAWLTTEAQGLAVELDGELPYPDLKARRGDGKVLLTARASAEAAKTGETAIEAVRLEARFDGAAKGWIDTLGVGGATQATLNAGSLRTAELTLKDVTVAGTGPAAFDLDRGARLQLASSARARGAWPIMGAPAKTDDATIGGFKRMLAGFDVAAPGLDLTMGEGIGVALTRPARIAGGGGEATVTGRAGAPLFDGRGGGLNLAIRGRGLPAIQASIPRYDLTPTGMTAAASLDFKGALGPLIGAQFKTTGRVTLDGATTAYATSACVPATLERLELGANDVEALSASLCPIKAPLLTLADGAWRLRARAEKVSAAAPFLEARVVDGAGVLDLGGKGEAFQADAAITAARAIDAAPQTRFNPLRLTGKAVSRNGDLTADLVVADDAGHRLADAKLIQAASGKGGMTIDTGTLTLAEGGIQPAALSPLAEMVASPATGRVRFTGELGWEGETMTSGGVAVLEDVGFTSPAGKISGLAGRLQFTSLAPAIVTAPGQTLTAARIAAFVPLTNAQATIELTPEFLKVAAAQVDAAQGRLRVDPLAIPLPPVRKPGEPPPPAAPLPPWEGRLHVEGLQLADLVAASPFADRAKIDAKVTGVVPFVITPEGLRIVDGKLAAIQPGRISIYREALADVSAEGGTTTTTADLPVAAPAPAVVAPPPNTIADFAYQAMENLAFSELDVTLNSLPGGRLGALFHIRGRHDPPKTQELRLGIIDLITQRFLQRALPLPSGTPVNLTLDTSLNLDEVLRDVVASRADGSATVQP